MIQTQVPTRMANFYQRLAAVGLPKSFVIAQGLPDWWCEEYEQSEGAIVTAAAHIAKRLNLELSSLLNEQEQPRFILASQPKYKIQTGTDPQDLPMSSAIAAKVAEIVASACQMTYQAIEHASAATIRQTILNSQ